MSKQIREWIKNKKNKINETTQTPSEINDTNPADFMKTIQRLSIKLGEKSTRYMPLIRYVSRNPKMLSLLEELIEQSSGMQVSRAKQVFRP